ncbi:histone chaperone domain-containing protein [Hirsutella rhossiliensis]|uniref:Histone chaperone domain-containing protein n=1 Tax=Hirsutella rhossiliensis TaxID=111463 RepID=A0A9P8N3W5_9HYPO|nr:histone chaperone domain-containing protein [Hirsutella rhossiliensis]KAH0966467.1 histone chaperone domain-containing protein [Hirsutella rhossiliensis]
MAENGSTLPASTKSPTAEEHVVDAKGKGKAVEEEAPKSEPVVDDDDDDEDDEEDANEGDEDAEEDGMEEIDLNNILEGGRRTRGTKIDFAKAAEQHPAEDEDEEDDEDFEPTADDTEMTG